MFEGQGLRLQWVIIHKCLPICEPTGHSLQTLAVLDMPQDREANMTINLHAKIEIGLLTALLLGSCAEQNTVAEAYDLADVARANSVNALYRVNQLEGRVEELEARLGM